MICGEGGVLDGTEVAKESFLSSRTFNSYAPSHEPGAEQGRVGNDSVPEEEPLAMPPAKAAPDGGWINMKSTGHFSD